MSEECTHNCSTCSANCSSRKAESLLAPLNELSSVKKVVAVVKGKDVTVDGINAAMKAAASDSFGYNEDQIVSSDIIGIRYGSLFDATQTMVAKIDEDTYQVQVVSWYDNENSYTSQMVRTIKYFAELN